MGPPFPCTSQLQVVFQTSAFKCILCDTTFIDVTVFDEHGSIFWAASSVASLQMTAPYAEDKNEAASVDFDRDTDASRASSRWILLSDSGVASIVMQLSSGYDGDEQ